ncbi:hypothetical protein [Microbispora sp. H10830]|uniref:hypothetical protein n=1 Tax=Microbispora sp. H10830 TaxID=2729109 RepID=UPI001601F191|nr:hypothetical protein [Microbispora sp. H10830]
MGRRAWVERWFDAWFQDRVERQLDARVDARLQVWADTYLKNQLDAHFESRFDEQFGAWADTHLKSLLDGYFTVMATDFVEHKFDIRFFTWADTWADAKLKPRLDSHFDSRLKERLDTHIQARVANRISHHIDRRIAEWLHATRTKPPERTEPGVDDAQTPAPAELEPAATLVTAAELASLLRKAHIRAAHVRRLLRGNEASSGRPHRYRLGDAAASILLRKAKPVKGNERRHLRRQDP